MNKIHLKALQVATRFKRAEADLISVLQEVELEQVHFQLGYTSVFNYCVQALALSEAVAANFIAVSRKARLMPALQNAIHEGTLSVSKARKLTPVLTSDNQKEWVEKAKLLSSRQLELAVAQVAPESTIRERIRPVAPERVELRVGLKESTAEMLRRVQDLESQRQRRSVTLEETLETLVSIYVETKDPVKRAARVLKRAERQLNDAPASVTGHVEDKPLSKPLRQKNANETRSSTKYHVLLRDGGQCTYRNIQGKRCENRRWIDLHHIKPRAHGGEDTPENLATLCAAHHRYVHRNHEVFDGKGRRLT